MGTIDKPAQVSIEAQIEACEWAQEVAGRDAKWSTPHEDRWRALRAAAATLRELAGMKQLDVRSFIALAQNAPNVRGIPVYYCVYPPKADDA